MITLTERYYYSEVPPGTCFKLTNDGTTYMKLEGDSISGDLALTDNFTLCNPEEPDAVVQLVDGGIDLTEGIDDTPYAFLRHRDCFKIDPAGPTFVKLDSGPLSGYMSLSDDHRLYEPLSYNQDVIQMWPTISLTAEDEYDD